MYDYHLKASNFNEMNLALIKAKILIPFDLGDGSTMLLPKKGTRIDHIGEHIKKQMQLDSQNNVIQDAIVDKMWHTNIRVPEPLTEEQKQILPLMDPPPSSPSYIFG